LLKAGEMLSHKETPGAPGSWRRAAWLFTTSSVYQIILSLILFVPNQFLLALTEGELNRIVSLAKLAVEQYESGGEGVFDTWRWLRWIPMPRRQKELIRARRCTWYATLHYTLATAYLRLPVGDIAQNFEAGLRHYEFAITSLERENLPTLSVLAAGIWTAVGTAWLHYPTEHRRAYAERAAEAFSKAKAIMARYGSATNITRALSTRSVPLGVVAAVGVRGLRAALTGTSDQLVEVLNPFFGIWVNGQLGVVYRELGEFEKACECFELALEECAKHHEELLLRPIIELNKGFTYLESRHGDPGKNLSTAIESFDNALRFAGKGISVQVSARARFGDVRACFALEARRGIKPGKREAVFERLLDHLRGTAKLTRSAGLYPLLQESLFLLAKIYKLQNDIPRAYRALALAARVADRVRRRARTVRLTSYLIGSETPLYDFLIRMSKEYALRLPRGSSQKQDNLRLMISCAALNFAERGRTAFLQTELANRDLLPKGAHRDELEEFHRLRRQWRGREQRLLEQESDPNTDPNILVVLRAQRNQLESRYLAELTKIRKAFDDPAYDPDRPISPVRFNDIRAALNLCSSKEDTALVEYHITDQYLVVFVLLPSCIVFAKCGLSRGELDELADRWQRGLALRIHYAHWEKGYLLQTLERLKPAVEIVSKSVAEWEQNHKRPIKHIFVVPHRFLHLVPLHAVALPGGRLWGETVSIQYVPSASVLCRLLGRGAACGSQRQPVSFEVPTQKGTVITYSAENQVRPVGGRPLVFNHEEVRAVVEATRGDLLEGPEAVPEAVKHAIREADYIHFACHGRFSLDNPLDAALELAPDRVTGSDGSLSLGEIFESVYLSKAPLVVLSACETGLTKVEEWRDEYIGLPAGFLYAGAKTVVSTLWPVADVGTWLLMRSFAQQIAAGATPARALRYAQHELRGLSREYVLEEITRVASKEPDPYTRQQMLDEGQNLPQDELPFAGPYWWAGFTVNGL
jgi:CHAT domain-containing protein/tetratricopeptide (TPR) repeat protein